MKIRATASLLFLAVVGVVLVAGCGGGGGSSSSGGGEGSSAFASAANAACKHANQEIAGLGNPQQSEVAKYMEGTEAVLEELHEKVQAAAGESAAEAAYVKGLAAAVPILNEMANAARNENFDAVRELSAGLIEIHLGELAEAAELETCAEVSVTV